MPAASIQLKSFVPSLERAAPNRPSLFVRLLRTFQEARLRAAEREVARYIEGRGGRLTDDLERRIERHFG